MLQNTSSLKTGFSFEIAECRSWIDLPQARNAICLGDSSSPNDLIEPFLLASKAPIAIAMCQSRGYLPMIVTMSAFVAANSLLKWHRWRKDAKWSRYMASSCLFTCMGIAQDRTCPGIWTNFTPVCSSRCGSQLLFVRMHLSQGCPPSHCSYRVSLTNLIEAECWLLAPLPVGSHKTGSALCFCACPEVR